MNSSRQHEGGAAIQEGVRDAGRGPASPRDGKAKRAAGEASPFDEEEEQEGRSSSDAASANRSGLSRILAAAAFGGLTFGAGALGASVSKKKIWYRSLLKSKATPPSNAFAPVWTFLYGCIAYSGYRVWSRPPSAGRSRALALWAAQLALNASWSPLFFGAHRPRASALVSGATVPTIAAYSATARAIDRPAAALMLPYLGWSAFATYLNAQVVRKNAFRL